MACCTNLKATEVWDTKSQREGEVAWPFRPRPWGTLTPFVGCWGPLLSAKSARLHSGQLIKARCTLASSLCKPVSRKSVPRVASVPGLRRSTTRPSHYAA